MVKSEHIVLAIFGSASALTALVLVFLGLVAAALQSVRGDASAKVRRRPFKIAGGLSFAAFLAGVACDGLSVSWLMRQHHTVYIAVVVTFVLELVLLVLAAGQVAVQMIFSQ